MTVINKPQYNIRAINISASMATAAYNLVADELADLKNLGVFIACASGNGGNNGTIYPANSPSTYAVGGVTETDQITVNIAGPPAQGGTSYGTSSTYLDMMAPGRNQPSAEMGSGGRHFITGQATSFATPWVTGLALLIKQINPNFTPDEIIDIMQDSSTVNVSIPGGWTEKRIDIDNALTEAYARIAPSSLTGVDIGSPTPAGSTTGVGADGFDVVAGGNDIWQSADAFHFAHTQVTGDFDVKARVDSFSAGSDSWAKAGIMARTALTHTSANVAMLATPGVNGYRFQVRPTTSATTTGVSGTQAVSYPNTWVRLKRTGNQFTGYSSSDGTNWTQVSSQSVSLPTTVYLGLGATSHNTSAATTVKFRTWGDTTPLSSPFNFTGGDVGSPAIAGSTTKLSDSSYDVAGAGNDIWGGGDQFQFGRQQVTGNFDVKVRLQSFSAGADPWAKAGLMARKSLAGNSENFAMLATPGANGYRFQKRATLGGTTTADAGAQTANLWVRLARVGDTFTGYSSNDGVNWTTVGSGTLAMGSTIYLGLAVTSHNTSALTTVNFRDLSGTIG